VSASHGLRAVVAVPANNEEQRIGACLAALSLQRDRFGAPIPVGTFEIVVLVNNSVDDTAMVAREISSVLPNRIDVVVETLSSASAGRARKRAMDLAAERLEALGTTEGFILTTDADSCVSPTWIAEQLDAFAAGVACVAGYVDGYPLELAALGSRFLARGRLEDLYLSRIAEIDALCDPRRHDPWPNHRVSSGASLGVTLHAYRLIGGLPDRDLGEDAALTAAIEKAGLTVRHSLDVCVTTSCRLNGRAVGGAADTMRARHDDPDSPCDPDLEPAFVATRRAILRGRLRQAARTPTVQADKTVDVTTALARAAAGGRAPMKRRPLRPADLPREIARANAILRRLHLTVGRSVPADRRHHEERDELAVL